MSYTIVNHVGSELMTVKMRDKSFAIEWNKLEMNAHSASVDKSALWHKRFGHFNYASLKNMSSMSFSEYMPTIDVANEVCDVSVWKAEKASISYKQSLESFWEATSNSKWCLWTLEDSVLELQ